MRRLKATAQTVHFGFLDGSLAPGFEVESGEEFGINTVSADPEHDVPRDWIPKAIPEIFERAPRGTGPHILTGPIAVKGAQPGDVLQIDILEICLTQPYGYNIVSPLKGMFGNEADTADDNHSDRSQHRNGRGRVWHFSADGAVFRPTRGRATARMGAPRQPSAAAPRRQRGQ